jgi:hypothetical protein
VDGARHAVALGVKVVPEGKGPSPWRHLSWRLGAKLAPRRELS